MTEMKDKIAVLVSSCDKYADLWVPFFSLFRHYWPDCPFDIYLINNSLDPGIDGVRALVVGEDVSWSDSMAKALGMLEQEYVLLFHDDLLLSEPIITQDVLEILGWMMRIRANYLRLYPKPGPDKMVNSKVGLVVPGAIYRTALIVAAWKKDVLRNLLKRGENAWEFEREGSKRSDRYGGFYSAKRSYFHVINSSIKSRWRRKGLIHLRKHGMEPDLSIRRAMTLSEELGYFLRRQRSALLRILPSTYRRKIVSYVLSWGDRVSAKQ